MSFNTIDTAMGAKLMQVLGEPVTYRRCNGETVSTYAAIDLDVEVFGAVDSGVAEYRNEISLLVAAVGTPQRGDSVITAAGVVYTIHDILPNLSDKVDVRVSAK